MKKLLSIMLIMSVFLVFAQETPTAFTLEEAINYALENNYNVKSASKDIDLADQKVQEAISSGLPQISGNVNYDYYIKQPVSILPDFITPAVIGTNQALGLIDNQQANDALSALSGEPQAVTFGTKHNFSAGAKLEQLIFSGSYLVGLQSAKAFREISKLGKEKTESQIKEAIVNAYTAVKVAELNQGVIKKNLDVSNKNVFEISEIYKAGFAEEQSVDQLKFSQKQLETSYNFAQRQKEIAKKALKYLMGLDQSSELNLTTAVEEITKSDLVLMSEDDTQLENHIDIKLAENTVKVNELQVKYQKTFALPTLSAFLSHTYSEVGNEFVLFNEDKTSYQTTLMGIRMNIPIFSSFQRSARTQQAKLSLEKAELDLTNAKQQLTQKVESAKLDYLNALDNHETSKELVELSQKIYDKEKVKFFEGMTTSTQLTTAETQLYQSENQYIQSILQLVSAKTALNQTLGNY